MSLQVLVIGAGGHGRVIADALRSAGRTVLGFLDVDARLHGSRIHGLYVLGDDRELQKYTADSVRLANGVGSVADVGTRRRVYERLSAAGYRFDVVQHATAVVAESVALGAGAQVMAGSVLQPGVSVGEDSIINTGALVDHDCTIGAHCHIAPGAILSGSIRIGDGCHIGTGASVIQGVSIGAGALVAAGAVVIRNVAPGTRVLGVPARVRE